MFGGILVLVVTLCVQSFWGGGRRGGKGSRRGSEQSQPSSHLSGRFGLTSHVRGDGRGSDTSERQPLGLQDSVDRAVGRALERLAGVVLLPPPPPPTHTHARAHTHTHTHTHTHRDLEALPVY